MAQLPRYIEYENSYNFNIISRIPVVIKIDGRSFSRVTKHAQKPFCHKTKEIFDRTMLAMVKQIDGAVFAYQYSDKIIFILRNDRSPEEDAWFGNNITKMAAVSASMATYEFMTNLWGVEGAPNFEGSITFASHAFGVPSIKEAVNYLIHRQWRCMNAAVNDAVHSVLWPRYGRQTAIILEEKDMNQRRQILDEAGLEFNSLPAAYRLGTAAYLIPTLAQTAQGQVTRHKWALDFDIPVLSKSGDWLRTIITTGSDIFKPDRDYNESIQGTH
jgi:tRNA(His) 5'-end guanylyltransferase